ncbi:TlpA family protein disulfide reductase, partial [Myxococcota bacterium]|nr:TlpA family protein disulfide reductase [Myxococcota bacterium]
SALRLALVAAFSALAVPILFAAQAALASEAGIGLRAPACELTRLLPAGSPSDAPARPPTHAPTPASETTPASFVRAFEGRITLVDFWASWCPTCEQAFVHLNALARDYRDAGLEVVAVNLDADPRDALDFLARRRIEFEVARDATGRCPRGFGLVGMPQAFLIDTAGRVQAVTRGFRASDVRTMRERIEVLLERAPSALPAVAAGRAPAR